MSGRLLTAGIVDLLTAAGLLVGDSITPDGGGWQGAEGASTFVPYTVVYPVTGGFFEGPMCTPFADARPDYIVSSFGATAAQAQFGNDRVHATLTTQTPSVVGSAVQLLIPDVDGGVVRDDDVTPHIYYSPSRWRAMLTPA